MKLLLSNAVECDEASVIAGHKGQPKGYRPSGATDVDADCKEKLVVAPWRRKDHPSLR